MEYRFKVAPVWKGSYNENITYDISDEVKFTSDMVEEITENTPTFGHYRSLRKNNDSPLTDNSSWLLILDLSEIETTTKEGKEFNERFNNNEASRILNENHRIEEETQRNVSEAQRVSNENIRKSLETNRQDAETNRRSNENSRIDNEIARNTAENQRTSFENSRQQNENTRISSEENRVANENTRQQNESTRQNQESTRQTNENNRIQAENQRVIAEQNRETQEGTSADAPNALGSRWARYRQAEFERNTTFSNSQTNRENSFQEEQTNRTTQFNQSQTARQNTYNQAEGTPEDEPNAEGSRWARYLKAESDRDAAIDEIKEDYTKKEDLENGNVIPALAYNLEAWANQKAIATPDTYIDAVRTTGGDIPIETSAGSKLESIKPVAGSKWTAKMLFNGSYNMLHAVTWGHANNQPFVGDWGGDFVYFLVSKLTLGTFGTADENNGLLFTDYEGANVQPTTVYYKPLSATVPQSLTDGTSITPTNVSYDGKTYKVYETPDAGWIIIPRSYYDSDICAHISWEDWYDKYVSLDEPETNPEATVGALILEGLLALAHSNKYLLGINEEVCDNVVFGETSATITHMVDELEIAANAWTNSATGESDSQGNTLYRHSATVSGIKNGGAACIEGVDGGIPLTVNGTTVSYIDTNATVTDAQTVFYQIPTTAVVEKAYSDAIFNGSNINQETGVLPINDCSIEAQVAMDGTSNITVKYAKNIVDQVAINAATDVPELQKQVEKHEERITELEDTAVRTNSYDASVAVGLADNFKGDTIVEAEFYKRKTGGTTSVGSGIAAIKEVKGKSIVWNQLVRNGNFAQGGNTPAGWGGYQSCDNSNEDYITFSAGSGNVHSYTAKHVSGHKYYIRFKWRVKNSNAFCVLLNAVSSLIKGSVDNWVEDKQIITATNSSQGAYGSIGFVPQTNYTIDIDKKIGVTFIDLTLMFGAGNEPATVAEFEKIFPLNYYDYNAGEVISFAGQNLTTTGKNQYNPATGKANLLGGQTYQIGGTYTSATIDGVAVTLDSNNCFTPTKDCVLDVTGGNDTDTFVGLYNGETNTYEPYEKRTLPLDPSQWRDKQGNLVFPYGGMHGVSAAYDYAKVDADGYIRKAVRCFGQVDLGTLSWGMFSGTHIFYAALEDTPYNNNNGNNKGICTKYSAESARYNELSNKAFTLGSGDVYNDKGSIIIRDDSYSDATAFKTAMQGVPLIYILKIPVEIELATPVYAKYLVDKDGTEEITPANGTVPYTTMANLSILYAMDARGEVKNLPKNYLSKESAENMLNAMVTAGIIASYTMTWDSINNRYAFVITAPVEPEENTQS